MSDPFQSDPWDEMTVNQLLQQARSGSAEARNLLFGHFRDYLAFVANEHLNHQLHAKVGASDVVQESYVKAMNSFDDYRGGTAGEFRGWLRQIAINETRQIERSFHTDKRQVSREQTIHSDNSTCQQVFQLSDSLLTPGTEAIAEEQAAALLAIIARLPDDYQNVIRLRNWEGLQFNEIADRLGMTESKAAKLWYRGLIKIQNLYQQP